MDDRQELQLKADNQKMEFTLWCCVAYCFSMTIVCGHFAFNTAAFTGLQTQTTCLAVSTSDLPVLRGGTDVALRFQQMMNFGFATNLVGIFADASMAIRGYSKQASFKMGALIFVSLYTIAFLVWFIWIQVLTFGQLGKVCSGFYLTDPQVQ